MACSKSAVEPSPLRAACAAVARRLLPPGPHVVPHRMPSFRLSAERGGVQPAAELRHLQRHGNELHVLRAPLPVPCPQPAVEPPPARCVRRGHLRSTSHLPGCSSPRIMCPPFGSRQYAMAFNQPLSFDTSSVVSMFNMFSVRSARGPWPLASPCRLRCHRSTRLPPAGPHLAPHHMCPPFDSTGLSRRLVRRQQTAHRLRVCGQLGIHQSVSTRLGFFGKLHKWLKWLEPPPRASTPPDARRTTRL